MASAMPMVLLAPGGSPLSSAAMSCLRSSIRSGIAAVRVVLARLR
jgi:hypothetical protein